MEEATWSGRSASGGERAETDQGDVVGLSMSRRELTNILQDGPADQLRAAGGVGEFSQQAAALARVIQLFTKVSGVGDTIGIHDDDVPRIELDLGLPVFGVEHDSER